MKLHPLTQELFICLGVYAGLYGAVALITWYGFGYLLTTATI